MIRIPRTKRGLLAYIFAIFMLTFSIFETSHAALPRRIVKAPSPSPLAISPVLGDKTDETFLVTKVIDGNTIEVDTGQTIRLIGVDTPNYFEAQKQQACFGKESYEFTKTHLLNKEIRLVKDVSETDHVGRLPRYVYLGNEFFNNTLVSEGYAHALSSPPDIAEQRILQKSEQDAIFNSKGLWHFCTSR